MAIAVLLLASVTPAARAAGPAGANEIDRGRYLIQVSGCNDCHTPNYGPSNGKVDEKLWLTGDALGWSGPWGTTYATNLRLLMQRLSREQWIAHARTMEPRPPMPWYNVRAMSEQDLSAIHAYVRHLGPAGTPAPASVAPGRKAPGPVVRFPE
ncbi:MAG: c-type cytochrome [Ramlibacter sp.]